MQGEYYSQGWGQEEPGRAKVPREIWERYLGQFTEPGRHRDDEEESLKEAIEVLLPAERGIGGLRGSLSSLDDSLRTLTPN